MKKGVVSLLVVYFLIISSFLTLVLVNALRLRYQPISTSEAVSVFELSFSTPNVDEMAILDKERDVIEKSKKEIYEKYKDVPELEMTKAELKVREDEINRLIQDAQTNRIPLEELNKRLEEYGIYYVGSWG